MVWIFSIGLPLIFTTLIPNSWFKNLGIGIGKTISVTLNKLTFNLWEFVEDHVVGAFISFVNGISEGSALDDSVTENSVFKKKK
jgi:hypothetical protein